MRDENILCMPCVVVVFAGLRGEQCGAKSGNEVGNVFIYIDDRTLFTDHAPLHRPLAARHVSSRTLPPARAIADTCTTLVPYILYSSLSLSVRAASAPRCPVRLWPVPFAFPIAGAPMKRCCQEQAASLTRAVSPCATHTRPIVVVIPYLAKLSL